MKLKIFALGESLLKAIIAAAAFVLTQSVATAGVAILVDKGAQRMTVEVDGAEFADWPVSTGKAGYETPDGTFTPFRLEKDHFSKEWDDAPMPFSIFFTKKGHAIHGTLESRRLGRAASHGCIRLSKAHAATLFDLVKAQGLANVTVEVFGGLEEFQANSFNQAPSRPRGSWRSSVRFDNPDDWVLQPEAVPLAAGPRSDFPPPGYWTVPHIRYRR